MLSKTQVEKIQSESGKKDKVLSLVFNALSDPSRLQIFKILLERNDVCVSDIANILNVSVPAASRQLSILESSGLVEKVRQGQSTCFRVQKENTITNSLIEVLKKGRFIRESLKNG